MNKRIAAGGLSLAVVAAALVPATAEAADTVVTLTVVAGGTLSITAAATASMAVNGTHYEGSIFGVEVTDETGSGSQWAVTATHTGFVSGATSVPGNLDFEPYNLQGADSYNPPPGTNYCSHEPTMGPACTILSVDMPPTTSNSLSFYVLLRKPVADFTGLGAGDYTTTVVQQVA